MSLVEVLMAMAILGVLIFATVAVTSSALLSSRNTIDKQFATQKALSILEELKTLAQGTQGSAVIILDQYDDGTTVKPVLTIQRGALPGDAISGNIAMGPSAWLYSRRVSVQPLSQGSGSVRLVRVAIFKNENGGQRLLAEVSGVIRTLSTTMPPTQVYDVYALIMENVPGWWVSTSNLFPVVQNALADLQSRNPGLEFRVHYITSLSYGRDQEYRPYINKNAASDADVNSVYYYPGALPQDTAKNPPLLSEYYASSLFKGHMLVDATDTNAYDATTNPYPYAIADQYNHSMRYYDEKALNTSRISAGTSTEPTYRILLDDMIMHPDNYTNAILINLHGEMFPFPPTRNYSDPAKDPETVALQNLRVVTHPENLEYSNTGDVYLRVYAWEAPYNALGGTADAAYMTTPVSVLIKGVNLTATALIRRIEGGTRQTGGGSTAGQGDPYVSSGFTVGGFAASGNRMSATVAVSGSDTLITFKNTPYRTPFCPTSGRICTDGTVSSNNAGLNTADNLYGMQYIPAPLENFASNAATAPTAFAQDLTDPNSRPKNTARWVIKLPAAALTAAGKDNNYLTIETRIGDPAVAGNLTTGTLYPTSNHPADLSRTYVWRGTDVWLYGDGTDTNPPHIPMSERFQFQGDPRHCPYADLKRPHASNPAVFTSGGTSNEHRLGMGYNRFFDDFESPAADASASWPGWKYTAGLTTYGVKNDGNANNDGWYEAGDVNNKWGQVELDVPHAFQMVRTALTSSRAVYTTMTGYSYYYIGIGNEIGYDKDGATFGLSIPVSQKPYTGAGGTVYEQTITNDNGTTQTDEGWGNPGNCGGATTRLPCGVKYIRGASPGGGFASVPATNYWWSISWLGELYPDASYTGATGWHATGNLPTGNAGFARVVRALINPTGAWSLPTGTDFPGGDNNNGTTGNANAVHRLMAQGSATFFDVGNSAATFHHNGGSSGTLGSQGLTISSTTTGGPQSSPLGYNTPLLTPVPSNRQFGTAILSPNVWDSPELDAAWLPPYGSIYLTTAGGNANQWTALGTTFTVKATPDALYYSGDAAGRNASGLVSLGDPLTKRKAWIVVNGLSPSGDSGTNFMARWSVLSLIHSYLYGGVCTSTSVTANSIACTTDDVAQRVTQLPRVSITHPAPSDVPLTNPDHVDVIFTSEWKRWDENEYTPEYDNTWTGETAALQYQFLYSADNGVTWKYGCGAAGTATPGVRLAAADPHLTCMPTGTLPLTVTLNTPAASFPAGNYLLRIEAYRSAANLTLHYAFHQYRAYISR